MSLTFKSFYVERFRYECPLRNRNFTRKYEKQYKNLTKPHILLENPSM